MRISINIYLLIFIFLISAQIGYSCTCVQSKHIEEINKTDFIFVGTVIGIIEDKSYVPPNIEKTSESKNIIAAGKRYLIKFKVEEKFKGLKENEINLVNYGGKVFPCAGISFQQKKTFLIYAYEDKSNNEVRNKNLCSRTQSFDKKSEDYKELLSLKNKNQIEKKKS